MGRHKEQEGLKNKSISLYEKQIKMTNELIARGYYSKVSEIVRHGIETVYNEKLGNSINPEFNKVQIVLDAYKVRKESMSVKGIAKYEHYSKSWIEGNSKMVEQAFPNKSVDEVYTELEKLMRVN